MNIDVNKVSMKYMILSGTNDKDELFLLYQIAVYLNQKNAKGYSGDEFCAADISMHTVARIDGRSQPLLDRLIEKGYVQDLEHSKYKLLKTPW